VVFLLFLVVVGCAAAVALSIRGLGYYRIPLELRPFSSDYAMMKPSGPYSHGLGIIGSAMVIAGVAMYSTRKRVRAFRDIGRVSRWLEFHIFLCLTGPVLIIYHTTFKVGGVAAITFWTMLSVVSSGVIGRFLYTRIPHASNGAQMSSDEIATAIQNVGTELQSSAVGRSLAEMIDKSFAAFSRPSTFGGMLGALVHLERLKSSTKRSIHEMITKANLPADAASALHEAASSRATLIQKSLILSQVEKLFFYWHAVHLPFTIIMFITLAMHITVVVLLGYSWFF
jgi:hypothetical protein